jgi:hypothetical protein
MPPSSRPFFRAPSAGGGLGLNALAASSASSSGHTFEWDDALRQQFEGNAVRHNPRREKADNAKLARENYRLVEQGFYMDAAGGRRSLKLPSDAVNRAHEAPPTAGRSLAPRHATTKVCVARTDTGTALRTMHMLGAQHCAALNFANAAHPGGGYLHGARAQEEDLCRLIPTLFSSLKRLKYPMREHTAFFSQGWLARLAGSYALDTPVLASVVSAAMPDLKGHHAKLGAGSDAWCATVRTRLPACGAPCGSSWAPTLTTLTTPRHRP